MGLPDPQEARRLYNLHSEEYSRLLSKYHNVPLMRALVTRLLGRLKGKKILFAGCGDGAECLPAAKLGAKVIGIDVSDKFVSMARTSYGKWAEFRRMDFTKTTFKKETFDHVVSILSIMYQSNVVKSLSEFRRILRNNGSVIIVVPHPIRKMMKYSKGNYFVKGKRYETWRGVRRFNYYWLFEDYVDTFTKAGFHLAQLLEPKPVKEGRESTKYPHIAIFVLKKEP